MLRQITIIMIIENYLHVHTFVNSNGIIKLIKY
jgi:hypothetical protein